MTMDLVGISRQELWVLYFCGKLCNFLLMIRKQRQTAPHQTKADVSLALFNVNISSLEDNCGRLYFDDFQALWVQATLCLINVFSRLLQQPSFPFKEGKAYAYGIRLSQTYYCFFKVYLDQYQSGKVKERNEVCRVLIKNFQCSYMYKKLIIVPQPQRLQTCLSVASGLGPLTRSLWTLLTLVLLKKVGLWTLPSSVNDAKFGYCGYTHW